MPISAVNGATNPRLVENCALAGAHVWIDGVLAV